MTDPGLHIRKYYRDLYEDKIEKYYLLKHMSKMGRALAKIVINAKQETGRIKIKS